MGAETLPAKAIGIRPYTAVVGIGPRSVLAGTRAQRFAIEGIAAVLTLQQALEQIPCPTSRLPGVPAILVELRLDRDKDIRLDQRGDRDVNPVRTWQIIRGGRLARLQRFAPLGA